MDGEICHMSDVIVKDRQDNRYRYEKIGVGVCWKQIPSPSEFISMCLSMKRKKAPGEDTIIGDVYKSFAHELLPLLYPLSLNHMSGYKLLFNGGEA